MLQPQISSFKKQLHPTVKLVYGLALCSLFLKIGIQLIMVFPNIAVVSHQIRNFVIGFIHLTTLGIITGFLLGILLQNKMISVNSKTLKIGVKCFVLGYTATEFLLFLQGCFLYFQKGSITFYYQNIFVFSIFLVLGLVLIIASIFKEHS